MDSYEVKELASGGASGAASAMCLDESCEHESTQPAKKQLKRKMISSELDIVDKESASAEGQQEIDALYEYYREVSGHNLNSEELASMKDDSIIACLLEESSLPYAKLTDKIYKKMKLQDGITKSSACNSVLNIGRRYSYGICAMDVDELEDDSDSCLWCWETQDLALLPSHLHKSLRIRRTARMLIHERILSLSGKLAGEDTPNPCSSQNSSSVNTMEVLNLYEICSFVEDLKKKNDADIKTKAQVLQATRKAMKKQQMMARQIDKEYKKKDREVKHMKDKAEREAKRIERENKRLKKHLEEAEREKKRKEKEEAELKKQASIKKQANLMECLFIRKPNNNIGSSGSHHSEKTTSSKPSAIIEESPVPATSAMDCTLSQAEKMRAEEYWVAHVSRWRKLSQHNRMLHWGVRRSPKVQLFPELKLQKSSAAPSNNMSTPTKEQASEESTGSLDFTKLLVELETRPREKDNHSRTALNSISSSVFLVKKLLQFDRSFRPAYYGTWRRKSSTVSSRQPFQRDPELNYDTESDEEWKEDDSGERLSDFEDDDESVNEHDSKIDVEEESENTFIVLNDHLSEDEGVKESVKSDESCSMQFLRRATERALSRERPVVISNLDHSKRDLLKAEDATAEKLCLQALCMKKYSSGPIIDVPVDVKMTMKDQEFCQSNKKIPRTPVPSKSLSDSDMPEFAKLVKSCSHGMVKLVDLLHERFPCISKAQLKNKVREIAEFTHNRWQVKEDILDQYSLCLSPDTSGSLNCAAPHFSQQCQPPDEQGKTGASSPHSALKPNVSRQQISAQGSSGSAPHPDP